MDKAEIPPQVVIECVMYCLELGIREYAAKAQKEEESIASSCAALTNDQGPDTTK